MAKKAYVVLKLKDQFSKPMKVATQGTKEFKNQQKFANAMTKKWTNSLKNKFKTAVKGTAIALGALGAAAAKTGLSEAMDLEGYRSQLETATKSTQKAGKIMKYAIDLANKTPFEGGELVEGAAKFEAMGMSAKKWLTYAGDMAGATNKNFDQSVEALIDAQTGELERLKEFGITKRMIQAQAEKMYKNEQVINNKGQIVNQKKFNDAMLALMKDKFAGGMEKQSKTLKGLWSTVTGVTKSALANVMGMTSDGTIRAGSALDIFKEKIGGVAKRLEQWQNDGTLDAMATKVGTFLGDAIDKVSRGFKWLKDNMETLKPVMAAVLAGFVAFNVVNTIATAIQSFTVVLNVLKVAFVGVNSVTIGWVLIIGAVIAIIYLLIKNWKQVVAWLGTLKEKFMSMGGPIGAFRDGILGIVGAFKSVIKWVGGAIDKVKSFLGLNTKKTIEIETIQTGAAAVTKAAGKAPKHATGTTYFAGGLTGFSEHGRAEEAIFPSGTRIIPADKAGKDIGSEKTIIVNLTVQGNVIGNEAYMEETGNYIARKIAAAGGNI